MPRGTTRLASAATRSGSQVLMQRTILPDPSPSAGKSSFSTTSSTCSVLNTARIMQRVDLARSAIDRAGRPPISASRAVRTGSNVEPGDGNAGRDQPPGIDLAHQPKTDNADRSAGRALTQWLRHGHNPSRARAPCDKAVQAAVNAPRCGSPALLSSSCRTKISHRRPECRGNST